MSDEETVLAALFAWLVAQTTGFKTTGRRVRHWTEAFPQPAMFLRHTGMDDEYDGTLPVRTMNCEIWVYSNSGQKPNAAPDIDLTMLVNTVRAAFIPDADPGDPSDTRFTIGGLVYWCRIEGRSDYSPGDQGPQAIARIPVRITLP